MQWIANLQPSLSLSLSSLLSLTHPCSRVRTFPALSTTFDYQQVSRYADLKSATRMFEELLFLRALSVKSRIFRAQVAIETMRWRPSPDIYARYMSNFFFCDTLFSGAWGIPSRIKISNAPGERVSH
jgi:hypothetical protein